VYNNISCIHNITYYAPTCTLFPRRIKYCIDSLLLNAYDEKRFLKKKYINSKKYNKKTRCLSMVLFRYKGFNADTI